MDLLRLWGDEKWIAGAGMNSKLLLLTISVLAVGMFAMPNTLSFFTGQHTYTNGTAVNCNKCHMDIYDELYASGVSPPPPHTGSSRLLECKVCHRTGKLGLIFGDTVNGISSNKGLNISTNPQAHSAVTVECIFCHDLLVNDTSESPQEILGSQEAHSGFYNASNQSTILKGGNEACVGCHTHTALNITWRRPSGYNMNADITGGYWNLSFYANETLVNTTSSGE